MTQIADLLDLHGEERDRLWVVASNGAVLFRYPPLEVVHEETFDAAAGGACRPRAAPHALVAVEERGMGYRVKRPLPGRRALGRDDPHRGRGPRRGAGQPGHHPRPLRDRRRLRRAGRRLGLHGTDYVVGWTAWLDLAPVGVSKASGLAIVADKLAVDRADVLAIGDGRNDIEMLEWAGRGVAMGQSIEEVRGPRTT